jgi:hypothetical protein
MDITPSSLIAPMIIPERASIEVEADQVRQQGEQAVARHALVRTEEVHVCEGGETGESFQHSTFSIPQHSSTFNIQYQRGQNMVRNV